MIRTGDTRRLGVGDLVKIRQSWSNLGNRVAIITEWWDETPIATEDIQTTQRWAYEVVILHSQQREEFYDYQLELLSEAKKRKA